MDLKSEAARLNLMVMNKLRKAVDADPEVDLMSKIPSTYSTRLAKRKAEAEDATSPAKQVEHDEQPLEFPEDDVRNKLSGIISADVVFPLSEPVCDLLRTGTPGLPLCGTLLEMIKRSQVIWKPKIGCHKIVLSCSPAIALKIILDMDDTTEYTTLQYLEKHLPDIPAPRPLGLVAVGERYHFLFMSLMPGTTLSAVWPSLDNASKRSVQHQLDRIFSSLRSFTPTEATIRLGGVAGEGCKDLRRHVRVTTELIWSVGQFDDWQFSNPHFGSAIYIASLRALSPPLPPEAVLSHNDLRPDNIIVELRGGDCRVTGIVDWQYSGFYPAYYESTKIMNGISPNESDDWYSYIPKCISPDRYPQKFLLDALWWKCVE